MKNVICFGEALIDFLQTSNEPCDGLKLNNFCQFPGGAPANAAVAVSKLGGKALFLGQVGDDEFGHFLQQSLAHYHVNTDYLFKHTKAKTALAFVMRDDKGERSFSFYRDNTADVIFNSSQIPKALFTQSGLFHFCSNTLTDNVISETTQTAIDIASQHNFVISFDVNLRHNLWQTGKVNIALTNAFVAQAHILKFSRDELDYLCEGDETRYINACLNHQCKLFIITNDGEPIQYITKDFSGYVSAPTVNVVDTTAGGDGFIGGLLFLLSKIDNVDELLSRESHVKQLILFAAASGAVAVSRLGAFPALPQFKDVENTYPDFL